MSFQIHKATLKDDYFQFNAMVFLPREGVEHNDQWCLFTHGYTASKTDVVNWAARCADAGTPSVIFDLPGHYLGSFNEVTSLEDFKDHAHKCFISAYEFLKSHTGTSPKTLVFGGHSLGALLSLKALELEYFSSFDKLGLGIGYGIGQHKTAHLFESAFYQKTLELRRQLVSPAIDSDAIFSWIKDEKLSLSITGHRVHLITGKDDVVVGEGGMDALAFDLQGKGNEVTQQEPNRLPHHDPSMAASHVYNFLRKHFNWKQA